MSDFEVFFQQEAQRAAVQQNRENTARAARSYANYTTTGSGELQVPDVFAFDCTFVHEPAVLNGVVLADLDANEEEAPDLVPTHFPRTFAGVYRWQQNVKGYYVGAWLYFIVDTIVPYSTTLSDEPRYILHHTIAFEGLALKDLPAYLLEEPRPAPEVGTQ